MANVSAFADEVEALFEAYPAILTPRQAADALQVSTKTVYRACRSGELDSCPVGRLLRIPKPALVRYARGLLIGGARDVFVARS